jgi:hypothetical protein
MNGKGTLSIFALPFKTKFNCFEVNKILAVLTKFNKEVFATIFSSFSELPGILIN